MTTKKALFLIFLSAIPLSSLYSSPPNHHADRYSSFKKGTDQKSKTSTRSAPIYMPVQEHGVQQPYAPYEKVSHSELGSICADMSDYCGFFAEQLADAPDYAHQSTMLQLLKHLLQLLVDLSDQEHRIVRSDSLLSNVALLASTLAQAVTVTDDESPMHQQYPLIAAITTPPHNQEITKSSPDDTPLEITLSMFHDVRSPLYGKAIVEELFAELAHCAQKEIHNLISALRNDTATLLFIAHNKHLSGRERAHEGLYETNRELFFTKMAWLSHHAAQTCHEFSQAFDASPLFKELSPFAAQLRALLSSSSLVYDHLASPSHITYPGDRDELASQFSVMISAITRTTSLTSDAQEIARLFDDESARELFLDQFFSLLDHELKTRLESFSEALTSIITTTFSERIWHTVNE
jgi:hypothetical protein